MTWRKGGLINNRGLTWKEDAASRHVPELGGDAGPGADAGEAENPYWAVEEAPPHPDPALGCIRRGLCCQASPGWFAPGEVEAAAASKGMAADEFVRRYVVIDHAEVDGARVEGFVPVKKGRDGKPLIEPATRTDGLYRAFRGTCIFFDGDGCGIYDARPIECRWYVCTNEPEQNLSRDELARWWRDGEAPPSIVEGEAARARARGDD